MPKKQTQQTPLLSQFYNPLRTLKLTARQIEPGSKLKIHQLKANNTILAWKKKSWFQEETFYTSNRDPNYPMFLKTPHILLTSNQKHIKIHPPFCEQSNSQPPQTDPVICDHFKLYHLNLRGLSSKSFPCYFKGILGILDTKHNAAKITSCLSLRCLQVSPGSCTNFPAKPKQQKPQSVPWWMVSAFYGCFYPEKENTY